MPKKVTSRFLRRIQEQAFKVFKEYLPGIRSPGAPEIRTDGPGPGPKVVACVSGGSDSMALLDILYNLHRRFNVDFDLHVIHFDHRLRGEDSNGDREFVVEACTKLYGLPSSNIHIRYWVPESNPPWTTEGVQENARAWRAFELEALVSTMRKQSEAKVVAVLAHHADDCVETMLLKLLRGASISSLKGIDAMIEQNGVKKLRPLLQISKQELVDYLELQGLLWREDASNQKLVYQRNKIRNLVIPLLADIAGSPKALADRFSELDQQVRMLSAFVDDELDVDLNDADFEWERKAPEFLERERLYRYLRANKEGDTVFFKSVSEIWSRLRSTHEKRVDLGSGKVAVVKNGRVKIEKKFNNSSHSTER